MKDQGSGKYVHFNKVFLYNFKILFHLFTILGATNIVCYTEDLVL